MPNQPEVVQGMPRLPAMRGVGGGSCQRAFGRPECDRPNVEPAGIEREKRGPMALAWLSHEVLGARSCAAQREPDSRRSAEPHLVLFRADRNAWPKRSFSLE